eukprot:5403217-Pyramimonas_sp.AAC.1
MQQSSAPGPSSWRSRFAPPVGVRQLSTPAVNNARRRVDRLRPSIAHRTSNRSNRHRYEWYERTHSRRRYYNTTTHDER